MVIVEAGPSYGLPVGSPPRQKIRADGGAAGGNRLRRLAPPPGPSRSGDTGSDSYLHWRTYCRGGCAGYHRRIYDALVAEANAQVEGYGRPRYSTFP